MSTTNELASPIKGLEKLVDDLKNERQRSANANQEVVKLKQLVTNSKKQIEDLNNQIQQQRLEYNLSMTYQNELLQKIDSLNDSLLEKTNQINSLQDRLEQSQLEIKNLDLEINETHQLLQSAQEQYQQLQLSTQSELEVRAAKMKELQQELSNMSNKLANAYKDADRNSLSNSGVNLEELASNNESRQVLFNNYLELRQTKDKLTSQLAEQDINLQLSNQRVVELEKELTASHKALSDRERQFEIERTQLLAKVKQEMQQNVDENDKKTYQHKYYQLLDECASMKRQVESIEQEMSRQAIQSPSKLASLHEQDRQRSLVSTRQANME